MRFDDLVCDYCGRPSTAIGRRRAKIWRYILLTLCIVIAQWFVYYILDVLGLVPADKL